MSQARVTDFFSQRKKGIAGPVKPAKQRRSVVVERGSSGISTNVASTRSRSSKNKGGFLCSSSVHEEFVRVIDEAVELNDGECVSSAAKDAYSSPRTPKRTSAETEFDLGAALFSATADHSTAKKRRQAEAVKEAEVLEKATTKARKARKKLVLPQDTPQAAVQPLPNERTPQYSAPAASVSGQNAENHLNLHTNSSPQRGQVSRKNTEGQASKALCKEDIAALKSRLQRIKKHAEELTSAAPRNSASTSSSPAGSAANATTPLVPKTALPATCNAKALKFTVAQVKELAAKAQQRKVEREAKESKQSEAQIPDSTEQPGYQRYHNLAQAAPPGLSLPYQYNVLAEMFRSMDTVVAMLYNRCEAATFPKIKQGVQDMMHKRFEESHVGQIQTVFPEAYKFRQEKNIPTFNSNVKKGSYQLTVEPVILSDQNEACPLLSASRLLERRRIFHLNLVSIVKQHHKVFLSTLVPPMSVPEDKLTRWHPNFNVDTVPAILASSMPQPPHTEKLSTAQEVLDKARSLITPKMEKALVSLALKTEDKAAESKEPTSPQKPAVPQASAPSAAAEVPTALKGVSQSLLDRIRAKEAQKLQAAMTRNPTQEERLLMMSRLPELARILRNIFVAEKKPALILELACNRMVASYKSALSTGEMEKHIRLLAEVAADWLTIHPIRKDFYLKLNKNMELNIILVKLSSRLRDEEKI
ncbi:DNA replication factor Cdt1 [Sander lucioperca]|uniref:Chromatin licensing and DNA replication factor 1 n=1 Tax=Sander lucioperca TaxID=283035 RepID=A0A8D0AFY9_SANLU|nr:DNA replication factor Cdt1 [Sander lucioperca]XP_035848322.1 DNA replication factor Cdt1 [Sander lucioperca]